MFLDDSEATLKKIAINVDERRNARIKDEVTTAVEEAGLNYKVEYFNNFSDIFSYAPEILIGHVNSENSTLICSPPSSLKWFHVMSAGVDRVVKGHGNTLLMHNIKLSNVSGIHSVAMREYVISMMLFFEKNLNRWIKQKDSAEWSRSPLSCLSGKTALVYGVGNIGKEVGMATNFFGMRTIGISKSGKHVEGFERVYEASMVEECAKKADYIIIAAPKTAATEGVFSKELLSSLKQEAVIINISRGELLDEQCLVDLLNSGQIRGAALDVFREEPLAKDSMLWTCKNLMITPHVSGLFSDGMGLGIKCFIDNLKSWDATGQLLSEVCIHKGY